VASAAAGLVRRHGSERLPGTEPEAGELNATVPAVRPRHGGLEHIALFYRTRAEYLDAATAFLAAGLDAGEPGFAAVPGPALRALRGALGPAAGRIVFADMTEMGRNPAWILPRVQDFLGASGGRPVRYIGEPIWPGRSVAEIREATRHEALLNLAFGLVPASVLCPYDEGRLGAQVLLDAGRTHPEIQHGGTITRSAGYGGPALPPELGQPLPPPPARAGTYPFGGNLSEVRRLVSELARAVGLPPLRARDLVLAVSEVTANTIQHAGGHGVVRIWHDAREVVCEVRDDGHITDPLAGRLHPSPRAPGGHGLWIVHQACDLVELRSGPAGTTIRLHMSLR